MDIQLKFTIIKVYTTLPDCKCMPTSIYNVAFTSTAPKLINKNQFPTEEAVELMK